VWTPKAKSKYLGERKISIIYSFYLEKERGGNILAGSKSPEIIAKRPRDEAGNSRDARKKKKNLLKTVPTPEKKRGAVATPPHQTTKLLGIKRACADESRAMQRRTEKGDAWNTLELNKRKEGNKP